MNRLVLAYRPRPGGAPAWPADPRWRFLLYFLLGIAAWLFPPWGALAAMAASLTLGRREPWGRWLAGLGWFWLFVAAPLLTQLPAQAAALACHAGGWPLPLDWPVLAEAAWRCLTFLALMMASQWFTAGTTVFEIQAVLAFLLRPLGRRAALRVSFLVSLAIGFIPWTLDEVAAVQEAAAVRSGGRGLRGRFAAFGLPLFVRVLAKARHTAEAIELRGAW
jgi:energy-coupling factor transporter transmembrane protein EcfT